MNSVSEHSHDHHHGHHHDHHHDVSFEAVNTAFIIAVLSNLLFTIFEAIYGFLANSVSLLGDAGHNLSDVLGLLLAWGAAYLASKKANSFFSYGYRRTTILAAIINALVLVFTSALIAFKSIEKLIAPEPVQEEAIIIVAAIGILVNAGAALLFMKGSKQDLNLRGAFLHLAYDALISAAVVVAGVLIMFTGALWIDPLAGLLIVVVILLGTWGLLRDSTNLLLDAVPQGIDLEEVRSFLLGLGGVSAVHDLHIWGMSTHENGLTAHLVMPENSLWEEQGSYAAIARSLEQRFQIHHVTLQVEKDHDCPNEDCEMDSQTG